MRVAVLSDTHLEQVNPAFAALFERYLQPADAVIHCGDVVGEEIEACLRGHNRAWLVRGNCDYGLQTPASLTLELAGLRLGVAHGWGRSLVGETVARAFGPGYDLILYGHTHKRDWSRASTGARLFNPGSVSHPRDGQASMAILTLEQNCPPQVQWIDL